jgi:hypothetical protein
VGISRDYPLKTRTSKQPIGEIPGYEIIPSHPLKYPRIKQGLEWRRFVGISRDYPLKTWTSKQPIGEIPGFEIIPSHPLKYPRSKQCLRPCLLLRFFLGVGRGNSRPTTKSQNFPNGPFNSQVYLGKFPAHPQTSRPAKLPPRVF